MGHIRFEPYRQAEHYIPDHFSHAELVHELRLEAPFAREGLIDPNAFWQRVEASYLSDPRMFLRQHQCPILDYIVRHDDLLVYTDPSLAIAIPQSVTIDPTIDPKSPPPTGTCTRVPGDPPPMTSVPEPSSIILAGLAAITILACLLPRAFRRRAQFGSRPKQGRTASPFLPTTKRALVSSVDT